METVREIILSMFTVTSMWSVIGRALLWFGIALIIIVSSDKADPEKSLKSLKSNLGFLMIFLVLSGGLVFLLFGFTPGA